MAKSRLTGSPRFLSHAASFQPDKAVASAGQVDGVGLASQHRDPVRVASSLLRTSPSQVVLAFRPRTALVHAYELQLDPVWVSKVKDLDAGACDGSYRGMSQAVLVQARRPRSQPFVRVRGERQVIETGIAGVESVPHVARELVHIQTHAVAEHQNRPAAVKVVRWVRRKDNRCSENVAIELHAPIQVGDGDSEMVET